MLVFSACPNGDVGANRIIGMRILVLSSMYPRASDPNAGVFVHNQVKSVRDKGCEVIVISPRPIPIFPTKNGFSKWRHLYRMRQEDTIDGVRVLYRRYLSLPRRMFREYGFLSPYYSIKRVIILLPVMCEETKDWQSYFFKVRDLVVVHSDGIVSYEITRRTSSPDLQGIK